MTPADILAIRLADPAFQRKQAVQRLATKLGYVFRLARIGRGLSVEELAAMVGCTPRAVRQFERGETINTGLRMAGLLAWGLDVEVDITLTPHENHHEPAPTEEVPE